MALSPLTLARTLKAGSLFAVLTGSMDVLLGTGMIGTSIDFPVGKPATALVDSQIRYLGAIWAGYGAMLWWASEDLQGRRVPLRLLGVSMFAGGIGRMLSGMKHGFSVPWVQVAMWVELVGPIALYLLGC